MDPKAPDPPVAPPGGRSGVWILEDSPLEAEMARRALAPHHVVEVFVEGSMVLERLANGQTPETLMLDWQLPGLSGLDVCRFLRASRDEIALPVLMVTSNGQRSDILEALAAGANDYLTKPYDVAELRARVGTLVRTSRLYDAQHRRERQLALAADIGVALTQRGDPARVLTKAAEVIAGHLDAALAAIWTVEGDTLVLAASAGSSSASLPQRAALRDHALGRLASSPSRWATADPKSDPRLAGEGWATDGVAEFWGYPLVVDADPVGVLVVLMKYDPPADAIDAMASVADVIALGVERALGEQQRATLLTSERRARKDAELANRVKDDFLATVSHELRTPLNAISGWAHMLRQGGLTPEKTTRALETIQRNAIAQSKLIEDLLDVSRIISGNARLELAPTDLVAVAELALETVRPLADAKGVRLRADLALGRGMLLGDSARLQQIIWNLLSNAVKFTARDGEVTLAVRREDDWLALTVGDSGQGIASSFLPHVFDRFRQADGSTARAHGGLGLGLAIVRHLVELHGGTITAASEGLDCGSVFSARLPVLQTGTFAASERPPEPELLTPVELVGLRVLVVDDDPDARELVGFLLGRCKAEVTEAASAAEAFARFREVRPALLVSDIGMPGEDGLSLIRKVRALSPEEGGRIPAVALSAYTRTDERTGAIEAGFDHHVAKPVKPPELLAILASLVAGTLR